MLSWSLRNRDSTVEPALLPGRGAGLGFGLAGPGHNTDRTGTRPNTLLLPRSTGHLAGGGRASLVRKLGEIPALHRATSRIYEQSLSRQFPRVGGCLAHCAPYHRIPGIDSEIKQTRQRPIKLISSHFKLSISNGCFIEI